MSRTGCVVAAIAIAIVAFEASAQGPRSSSRAFAAVRGWASLRWTMDLDTVRSTLRRMGARCTDDTAVGMFPSADHDGFAERTFVRFRCLMQGREVHIDVEDFRLSEVRVVRRGLSQRAALQRLGVLVRSYGRPRSTVANPDTAWAWSNDSTELTLHVVRNPAGSDWFATEVWRALPAR